MTVPPEFTAISKKMYTQLMMLFAHLYHAHFVDLLHLDMEGHLNSFCAHYLSESDALVVLSAAADVCVCVCVCVDSLWTYEWAGGPRC